MTGSSNTVTDYVIEIRAAGRPWTRVPGGGTEEAARRDYRTWLGTPAIAGGRTDVRLLKRTAVVTDEVLSSTTRP